MKIKWLNKKNYNIDILNGNSEYRKKHPEFLKFEMPKSFYFKIFYDRCSIDWAIIKEENKNFIIYFIDANGQAFDKIEYKKKKIAQRLLRKNKFVSSNNQKCPFLPIQPIYVKLHKKGRYSSGKYWKVQDRYIKNNNIENEG